jgi:hypothetical protein
MGVDVQIASRVKGGRCGTDCRNGMLLGRAGTQRRVRTTNPDSEGVAGTPAAQACTPVVVVAVL